MYKIIGADHTEYGPVNAEQIRAWINEGRIDLKTKIQVEGAAGWKTVAECPEFREALPASAGAPPPLPVSSGEAKLSGLAIASLVLGALGWLTFGVTALVGLVLGIIALVRINRSRGALRGQGLAVAGTILSGVLVVLLPLFAAMLLPALARAKMRAQSIVCMNNMKQLALGGMMYANDNKDRFPDGQQWCDVLKKYVPNSTTFQCPSGNPGQPCHYAFNARLSGAETKNVSSPAQTVLMFETDGGWNLSGGPELLVHRPRHGRSVGLVFADGHCEVATQMRLRNVRWDP